jgi:hypothetical protein
MILLTLREDHMAGQIDVVTLIGKRMRKPVSSVPEELPSIAEALRRVNLAIAQKQAA